MRSIAVAVVLLITAGLTLQARGAAAQAKPDFSGAWQFNQAKSMKPGPDGKIVLAALLGETCKIAQNATAITLAIKAGDIQVSPVYKLDGSESINLSPGPAGQPDIPVTSRVSWDGDKLVIDSVSKSLMGGTTVTVESKRVLYLDADGDLIILRTGSAASGITPSRSVYSKSK